MEVKLQIVADANALARAAADVFIAAARQAVESHGRFSVALSGGSTPKALYTLLVTDHDLNARVPWEQSYFFFGDERHVPPDAAESNFRMANEAMLSKVPIAASQVFRMKGEYKEAEKAAAEYERELRKFFQLTAGQFPRFDLVMLGMGPDGHTASLFPGTKALDEQQRLVTSNWVGKFYTHRITLTAPVLNNAACAMFMVHGQDKAQPLKAVLEGPHEPAQLPSQLIRPVNGTLLWLVDETAAGLLDRKITIPTRIAATG
jgi:6-phosphogluconolactonase